MSFSPDDLREKYLKVCTGNLAHPRPSKSSLERNSDVTCSCTGPIPSISFQIPSYIASILQLDDIIAAELLWTWPCGEEVSHSPGVINIQEWLLSKRISGSTLEHTSRRSGWVPGKMKTHKSKQSLLHSTQAIVTSTPPDGEHHTPFKTSGYQKMT